MPEVRVVRRDERLQLIPCRGRRAPPAARQTSVDPTFWHDKWANREIAFHQSATHALLVRHLPALGLAPHSRVFVPLCGKTLDIRWLLAQGHRVAGAELSPVAVAELFDELGVAPTVAAAGPLERHSAPGLDVFVGDVFELASASLGDVDAVYDRAALVAMPAAMRGRYATHLTAITATAPQLLISFEYEQRLLAGPPFAVEAAEVRRLYDAAYETTLLDRVDVPGGLKGKVAATENVWLLNARAGPRPARLPGGA